MGNGPTDFSIAYFAPRISNIERKLKHFNLSDSGKNELKKLIRILPRNFQKSSTPLLKKIILSQFCRKTPQKKIYVSHQSDF